MGRVKVFFVAVLLAMAFSVQVFAGDVHSSDGVQVASNDGGAVTSADSESPGGHTVALSVFMIGAAVLASPITIGGSMGALAVAWPAVIGSGAAVAQASRER